MSAPPRFRPLSAIAPRQPVAQAAPSIVAPTYQQPSQDVAQAAPAKKQGKLTAIHGSPPKHIVRDKGAPLVRGEMLGEGGFARVYSAEEEGTGALKAVKIIAKEQLKTSKNRAKLFSEIKIHQAMAHPHIVRFDNCFEDAGNVFMVLTLIRKRYTEPEARYYLIQLIGACEYMHSRSVIHRDLKLGNLLLDADMNLHVADFGLAALVRFPGERKKTVCGTPNYIAPEILFDQDNGHSFEVDVWYTLLVGKPPFQTKDVKTIYKKIRDNNYSYPDGVVVSESARNLISAILTTEPAKRPTLNEIVDHPFFRDGCFPRSIPPTARDTMPDFSHVPQSTWAINLARARRHAIGNNSAEVAPNTTAEQENAESARIEQDVQRVLDPGSPIAELLRSARKPLAVSPAGSNEAKDALRRGQDRRLEELQQREKAGSGRRRSVSFAADDPDSKENVPDVGKVSPVDKTKARLVQRMMASRSPRTSSMAPRVAANGSPSRLREEAPVPPPKPAPTSSSRALYEGCARTLASALATATMADAELVASPPPGDQPPLVFVTSWIDYTHKYGTAYQLTDGSSGVYFNDSTTMILSPDQQHFDYIARRQAGHSVAPRSHHTLSEYTPDLDRKVYLLRYFHDYMSKQLERNVDWTFKDTKRSVDMDFLVKYYRLNTAIVFRLSNDVLQVLLTSGATVVTFIGPDYVLKSYALSTLVREAIRLGVLPDASALPPSALGDLDSKLGRRRERIRTLVEKLHCCLDLLRCVRAAER